MKTRLYHDLTLRELLDHWRLIEQQHKPTVLFMDTDFSAIDQINLQAFRWYDDGTESGSTALALEDATHDLTILADTTAHLRFALDGDANRQMPTATQWRLYYDSGGGATLITGSSSEVQAAGTGSGLSDGGTVTNRLAWNGGKSFQANQAWQEETDGTSAAGGNLVSSGEFCEGVIALNFVYADLTDNDSITFSAEASPDGTNWYGVEILSTPTITIDKQAAQEVDRSGDDGIFMLDPDFRGHDKLGADALFLSDFRRSAIEKILADFLLAGDATVCQKLKVALEDDQILFDDDRISGLSLTFFNNLLLLDGRNSTRVSRLDDTLLLSDAPAFEKVLRFDSTDTLLLLDRRFGLLEKIASNNLLLADAPLRDLSRQIADQLLLYSEGSAPPPGQGEEVTRDVDDFLLLAPQLTKERLLGSDDKIMFLEKAILNIQRIFIRQTFLLDDARFSQIERKILEAVLVADALIKLSERIERDFMLFADNIELLLLLSKVADDSILLLGETVKEHEKIIADSALLGDDVVAAAFGVITRQVEDSVLFLDQLRTNRLMRIAEQVLLDDDFSATTSAAILRSISDNLLLSDSDDVQKEGLRLRSVADAIVLGETAIVAIRREFTRDALLFGDQVDEKRIALRGLDDDLLLGDVLDKELLKTTLDDLLLFDEVTVSELGVFLRSVSDTLLLGDDILKQTLLTKADKILLGDTVSAVKEAVQIIIRSASDQLLLVDRAAFAKGIAAFDALLLADEVTLQQLALSLRSVSDSLLIGDARRSTREAALADTLLLRDFITQTKLQSVTTSDDLLLRDFITQLQSVTTSDDLLLFDTVEALATGLRQIIASDEILLVDEISSLVLNQLLQQDGLLLDDTFDLAKRLVASLEDDLIFDDVIEKVRGLTGADRVLLADTVSTTFLEAFVQALIWAVLRARDLLGITTTWRDNFLGCKIDDRDYLSLASGYLRTADLRVVYVN